MTFISSLPLQKPQIIPPLSVALLALLAFIFENNLIDSLIYQRDLIADGQYWRLFTSHFFHTNFNHFLLNIAGLVLLWSLHGQYYHYKNYLSLLAISAFFISIGVYLSSPELSTYVGLSGVLHSFFIWGALKDIQAKMKTGYLLLLGVLIKVADEQLNGASIEVSQLINANVAIDAHLWGVVVGAVFFYFRFFIKISKNDVIN